jgi:hypothetical protein
MLERVRDEFRSAVGVFEQQALSCSECDTPGACCLDAHFVNVRITRLEAVAIRKAISAMPPERQRAVAERIDDAIERFGLDAGDDVSQTYACPLYESSTGCLVHDTAKPLPCISHACYSRKQDLPPDELLEKAELAVERLNLNVYSRPQPLVNLPVAIRSAGRA